MQKGCYVVMAECHASCTLAFSLAGEQLWMGRVEHRGEESLKLHYYQQAAGQPGKLGGESCRTLSGVEMAVAQQSANNL